MNLKMPTKSKKIKLDTSVDESVPNFKNPQEEKEWLDKQKERDDEA